MSGETRYYTNIHGWAGDWLIDMTPADTIYWDVIVESEGDYSITRNTPRQKSHIVAVNGCEAVALNPTKLCK